MPRVVSPTGDESATVLTTGKVRCSPSSPCSRERARCAWLRAAPLLSSPAFRAAALELPGRGGKAGSLIERESWLVAAAVRGGPLRPGVASAEVHVVEAARHSVRDVAGPNCQPCARSNRVEPEDDDGGVGFQAIMRTADQVPRTGGVISPLIACDYRPSS